MLQDLTLKSPTVLSGGVYNTITLTAGASGSTLDGVTVAPQATETTTSAAAAIRVIGASDVRIANCAVKGGMAISGVAQDGLPPDGKPPPGERVLGLPIFKGVSLKDCRDVIVEDTEISDVIKGAGFDDCEGVTFRRLNIHDVRTSHIVGASTSRLLIERCRLRISRPWQTTLPGGDHADFIHIWTEPGGAPVNDVRVVGNLIDQADGAAILGPHFDDRGTGLGFHGVEISDNTILTSVSQGMRLENVEGDVFRNILLQVSGDTKKAPQIIVAYGGAPRINRNRVADPRGLLKPYGVNDIVPSGAQPAEALAVARWMAQAN